MSKKKTELFQSVTFPELGQAMTVVQKAKQLQVHPETVIRHAAALGGRRIGRFWRFPWDHPGPVLLASQTDPVAVPHRSISYGKTKRSTDSLEKIRRIENILRSPRREER